jgi:hypothetical protein
MMVGGGRSSRGSRAKKILAHQIWTRRVSAQQCFTFHPPEIPELKPEHNPSLRCYRVPANEKAHLRKELELLGIDEFTIFGDLDHLAKRLRVAASFWAVMRS